MAFSTEDDEGIRRRPGRPRDDSRDVAILTAALEALAEVGYDRLTMDMVARRAHAGKGALYRRWPSKADLVIDAVKVGSTRLDVPDTGSLAGDLKVLADAATEVMGNHQRFLLMAGLATAASRDPELARVLARQMGPREDVLGAMWARAMDRGEIPRGRDCQAIWEVVPAVLFLRSVFSPHTIAPDLPKRLIWTVVYPLLTAPDQQVDSPPV